MRKYATTLIIWASLLLSELHTFWEQTNQEISFTIGKYYPMNIQWAVKYMTDEFLFPLLALAVVLYKPNRINKASVLAYISFCIGDVGLFFYDFKQDGELYQWNYLLLLISWILIYNYERSRPTKRQGVVIET